jgi:hypothetical protein
VGVVDGGTGVLEGTPVGVSVSKTKGGVSWGVSEGKAVADDWIAGVRVEAGGLAPQETNKRLVATNKKHLENMLLLSIRQNHVTLKGGDRQ